MFTMGIIATYIRLNFCPRKLDTFFGTNYLYLCHTPNATSVVSLIARLVQLRCCGSFQGSYNGFLINQNMARSHILVYLVVLFALAVLLAFANEEDGRCDDVAECTYSCHPALIRYDLIGCYNEEVCCLINF
ncbi:uncharacterized protein LOC116180913 [Photinus pyralis]|uniref:uncharacterized protein LOC116180913 n=1 Tax=Photinus pyralis TaxID=7054 RepID=UPI00126779B2|nr:uncharacterized protein LOC116180913 [Photinus pyralis]